MMKCNMCKKPIRKGKFGVCEPCFRKSGWRYNGNLAFRKCGLCGQNWVRKNEKIPICFGCTNEMTKPIIQIEKESIGEQNES